MVQWNKGVTFPWLKGLVLEEGTRLQGLRAAALRGQVMALSENAWAMHGEMLFREGILRRGQILGHWQVIELNESETAMPHVISAVIYK